MPGWGSAIGKIFDWFPGRRENIRNQIDKIKREMYEIQKKKPFTDSDSDKYIKLANKLRILQTKSQNG